MAKMYPDPISPDTNSDAERKMYALFRDKLDDNFTVMHSCKWVNKLPDGPAIEGECDFIILHPQYGALCVEVKGGGIEVKINSGGETWYSTDRHGVQHELKRSPATQAQSSQYALRDKLSADKRTKGMWSAPGIQVKWAVCFPDVGVAAGYNLGPNIPNEVVIDGTRAFTMQRTIEDIFSYWHSERGLRKNQQPGSSGVNNLVDVLAPSWKLKALKSVALAEVADKIEQLTQDQFVVLNFLNGKKRAVVTGGAGTGKTLLAMELATRRASEGISTLYMCFNRNLADWVKSQIGKVNNLEVMTFDETVRHFAKLAKISWSPPANFEERLDSYLPTTLLTATERTDQRFEAIVIDEGQDFRELWWVGIEDMLDENGNMYVFYDDNQAIYTSPQDLPIDIDLSLPLYTNCRNTRNIHDAFQPYTSSQSICNADAGPEIIRISTKNQSSEALLKRTLLNLVNEEGISPKDITLLTPRSEVESQWDDGKELGTLMLTWDLTLPVEQELTIPVSTIHSYKGLENLVVIMTELDYVVAEKRNELIYIGLSRAKAQVIILGDLPEPVK